MEGCGPLPVVDFTQRLGDINYGERGKRFGIVLKDDTHLVVYSTNQVKGAGNDLYHIPDLS